jgi:fused signal recognition particle receptor
MDWIALLKIVGVAVVVFALFGIVINRAKKNKSGCTCAGAVAEEDETHACGCAPEAVARGQEFVCPKEEMAQKQQAKLNTAMASTQKSFWGRINSVLQGSKGLSEDQWSEIEEILYTSDLGPKTVEYLLDAVKSRLKEIEPTTESVRGVLREELNELFEEHGLRDSGLLPGPTAQAQEKTKPQIWMVVGVNGSGKTTTIGKLAYRWSQVGNKVMIAAGDTFRAAADEQLKVWSERAKVEIFSPEGVTSPSAVAFDACKKATASDLDLLIVDTAGRLHTQKHLMDELKKMKRVVEKAAPGAPHEVLLVLDANSGQNALLQAKEFHEALGVTGVIVTKLDGSAKGGVAVGVAGELELPIRMIGIGEQVEDLRPFDAPSFVASIV